MMSRKDVLSVLALLREAGAVSKSSLSAEQQALFQQGYEPAERDVADMRRLGEKFDTDTSR